MLSSRVRAVTRVALKGLITVAALRSSVKGQEWKPGSHGDPVVREEGAQIP